MKKKEKKVERKVAGWATLDARVLQGRKMEVAERGREALEEIKDGSYQANCSEIYWRKGS